MESQLRLIAATKANIARLTAQIDELHSLREKERSALAELRLTVVPVGQLPPELLAEIFKLAVETPIFALERGGYLDMYSGDARVALRKILRLSQVCGHWRQLVLNSPQLWAAGVVDVNFSRTLTDKYLDGLKSRLARSTPHPISVSFTGTALLSQPGRMMDTIVLTAAPRWKNLQIDMEAFPFRDITRGTFQALERLHIHDCRAQMNTVTAFQSCPRLRDVTLRLVDSKIHLIQVPWWQLTHLDIVDDSLGGCRAALLQCSNLIRAAIMTSSEVGFCTRSRGLSRRCPSSSRDSYYEFRWGRGWGPGC
ncbi:hypothetical protein C8R46DRAFT_137508 [Mycena filopes]|nr:hypothetical protein C8R46DRAFT_137508 [Mycena filopes]